MHTEIQTEQTLTTKNTQKPLRSLAPVGKRRHIPEIEEQSSRNRPERNRVAGPGGSVTSGQFQGVQEQSSGSSVQYQVFPQIQTTEGQHIQINPANATALQDIQGQIQLIPSGNNQAIIATTNRTSSGSIIAQNLANQTVPVQIRPGVSIPLQLPIAGTQAQVVTSLPINIERVTLALPVINVATGSSSGQVAQSTDSRLSNGNQLLSTPVTTASVSVMPDSPPPSSTTTASTSLTANEMLVTTAEAGQYAGTANSSETSTEEAQMSTSETEVQNSSHLQSNGLQNVQDQSNSLQQVPIVGQPILQQIQIQQPQQQIIQAISPQSFQLQAGQTIQAIQQQSLQNVQLQAVSPTQILIRAPTLTPSGQIIWQTVQIQNLQSLSNLQVQNAGGGTIAQIAPVALAGTPITLNTSQIASVPNLQTVSVGNLGTAGVQVQGVPVTITSVAGKSYPFGSIVVLCITYSKGKGFPCPVVSDFRGRCSSPFLSQGSQCSPKTLLWSCGQHDYMPRCTEHVYLPTEVVPIYLLTFSCFQTARWVGTGAGNKNSSCSVVLGSQTWAVNFSASKPSILTILKRGSSNEYYAYFFLLLKSSSMFSF
uniref:Transcription factor Sp4 n=1 Tax=Naja naja TaxID=35670 RepID=A0A8C6XJC1_NAJNA